MCVMCTRHLEEGAGYSYADSYHLTGWYEGKELEDRRNTAPEPTRRPVWPARAVYGGWDHFHPFVAVAAFLKAHSMSDAGYVLFTLVKLVAVTFVLAFYLLLGIRLLVWVVTA